MSNSSRKFLVRLGAAIVLAFVIAGVAIIAYNAGRNSLRETAAGSPEVIVSDDGSSVTIELGKQTPELDESPTTMKEPKTATPTVETNVEPAQANGEPPADLSGGTQPPAAEQPTAEQVEQNEAEEDKPRIPVELEEEDIGLLLEVWDIIDGQFDGQLPEREDVTYSAIAGSLELLDDEYTRFINPETAGRMREQLNGTFEGIGAFVDMNPDGYLVIVRPMAGLPADQAGLQANDLVTHVDGESILGMSLEEITSVIKGPEGTEVTLTILRESLEEPFDVTVMREKIEIPIVSGEMLEDNIAYVRLSGFGANAAQQLEAKLEELMSQDPRGLIFDLRDNPGGFLSQSVQVADLFLDEGVVLYERDSRDFEEVFESESGDLAEEIDLVILVNAGSASASEIVAGAVKDRDRGILIGETTFGKGSVQQPHTLSNGAELRVTIARWYTPNNQSISPNGIAPDITVESPEEFGTRDDMQLFRATQYILLGR